MTTTIVRVQIDNTYTCGRQSSSEHWIAAPPPDADVDAWFDDYVHDLTGDGHPCGATEHALYEAEIVDAPGRPDLAGAYSSWEG